MIVAIDLVFPIRVDEIAAVLLHSGAGATCEAPVKARPSWGLFLLREYAVAERHAVCCGVAWELRKVLEAGCRFQQNGSALTQDDLPWVNAMADDQN